MESTEREQFVAGTLKISKNLKQKLMTACVQEKTQYANFRVYKNNTAQSKTDVS